MEANTVTLNNSNATVEKKMRKPSLPAKFNKFIQFGYFFLKQYNDMDGVTPIDENSFLDKLHLFDTVDNQQAFVQSFFDDAKNINKTIRKVIQAKLKADKKAAAPPKVKAPRLKKSVATDSAETTIEPTTKTSRRKAKIAVVPDLQDDLISELTSLANNTDIPTTNTATNTDIPKAEKKTKTDKPKTDKPKTDKPKAEKKPKADKPKAEKKPKLSKTDKEPLNCSNNIDNIDNIDNDDNEIVTSPVIIDGVQYLVDDSNFVYHFISHSLIGKLVDNKIISN
jgi:hypothetical protein